MVERIIEFSARNRVLVLLLTGAALVGARVVHPAHPAGRHPRPLRHPGDRLLALGPQPRHHRGPGHLSDRHRAARRAEGEGDPRLLRLRLQLRLRHLPGRHRPLLGALARPRVPEQDPAAPAARACETELGPDATSVGWVFQYALVDKSGPARPGRACAASRTGTCATTCSRCRASPRWRRSAGSSSSTR